MELTKENFNDFIGRLKFQNRGKGVDHHCTANPIFIVQSRERITGIDLSFDPETYWTDEDSECEWTEEEFKEQLAEYVADGGEHEDFDIDIDEEVTRGQVTVFRKLGYCENWEYVCAHLTREAAEAFIKRKKHDHRKLRIYVDSQYWCWEFNTIIKGLLDGKIIMESEVRRREDEGSLAECPCCRSLDIGGAHDTVHCYGCGLKITKTSTITKRYRCLEYAMRQGVNLTERKLCATTTITARQYQKK